MQANSLRKIVFVVCMLAALAFTMSADVQRAEAIIIVGPGSCTYYSNATYTTVVGASSTGCCGAVTSWGIITPYRRCERHYCPDVVCPVYE